MVHETGETHTWAHHGLGWFGCGEGLIRQRAGQMECTYVLFCGSNLFRENADVWLQFYDYKEAGPHLLLQAFLQRIVNGGGLIAREYGLGRGRTDLFLQWPLTPQGFTGPMQQVVLGACRT